MTIFGYTVALVVAFALLGVIFSRPETEPATTSIVSIDLHYDMPTVNHLSLTCVDNGYILFRHSALSMHEGESAHLVITTIGEKVKIVEKRGVTTTGNETAATAIATIDCLAQRRFVCRFDSEITGQWCTFNLTNVDGKCVEPELHF